MAGSGTATLETDGGRVIAGGDWTLDQIGALSARAARVRREAAAAFTLDARALARVDTAGANLLLELVDGDPARIDAPPAAAARLIDVVARASATKPPVPPRTNGVTERIVQIGVALEAIWNDTLALVAFIGVVLSAVARGLVSPRRWRVTSASTPTSPAAISRCCRTCRISPRSAPRGRPARWATSSWASAACLAALAGRAA